MTPIVLTTDFGVTDTYVGVMKGVIATIAPHTPVIDLSHAVRPQDIAHGAYTLLVSVPYFPAGTIFVTVVDPGVGGARRPVVLEAGGYHFVAPDNGVLSYMAQRLAVARCVVLEAAAYRLPQVSHTFHGRDIFAPAAAHLATGVPLLALGPPIDPSTLVQLPPLFVSAESKGWRGRVLHIDHFGNIITSLDANTLGAHALADKWAWQVEIGALQVAGLQATFADVALGAPLAYIGSDGFLEVAVRNGDAAATFGISPHDEVYVWPKAIQART